MITVNSHTVCVALAFLYTDSSRESKNFFISFIKIVYIKLDCDLTIQFKISNYEYIKLN